MLLKLLQELRRNPDDLYGRVVYRSYAWHYVHEQSTRVDLTSDLADEYQPLVDQFEKDLKDLIVDLNRGIKQELENELEYQRSDNVIIDLLDANEMYFDAETGERVDMPDFLTIDQIPKGPVRNKILSHYVDLFDRTPEEVAKALMRREVKFDKRGNLVDTSSFKRASQLPDEIKQRVIDSYRDWSTQDSEWAQPAIDAWVERLENMGFGRVQIAYSLGGGQGDGASFTADSLDCVKILEHMLKRQECQKRVETLVVGLIEA